MLYLSVDEVLRLHQRVIEQSGGSSGIRDHGAIESAVFQPRQTFGGADLYEGVSPAITLSSMATSGSLTPRWR